MLMRAARPEPSAEPLLLHEVRDGIATLTLHRPAQFNALSEALLARLQEALDELATEPAVRVVVLAGAGRAFCAGHDLRELRARRDRDWYRDLFGRCSRLMESLRALPQPTVARVHGVATAAGCQLVAACDLAVAAEEARFATSGIDLGLYCATPAVAVTRNLPRKRAFEILMTGTFLSALQAYEVGLVNRVVPAASLDAAVDELAATMAAKSPVAVRAGKRLFYEQLGLPLAEAYALAGDVMADNLMAEDAAEGIDAFFARRPPVWRGR
jgi:enoyl-CoA hydratase/carnithine racemase